METWCYNFRPWGDQWINLREGCKFSHICCGLSRKSSKKTPDCARDPGSAVVPSLGKSNLRSCNSGTFKKMASLCMVVKYASLISTTYWVLPWKLGRNNFWRRPYSGEMGVENQQLNFIKPYSNSCDLNTSFCHLHGTAALHWGIWCGFLLDMIIEPLIGCRYNLDTVAQLLYRMIPSVGTKIWWPK